MLICLPDYSSLYRQSSQTTHTVKFICLSMSYFLFGYISTRCNMARSFFTHDLLAHDVTRSVGTMRQKKRNSEKLGPIKFTFYVPMFCFVSLLQQHSAHCIKILVLTAVPKCPLFTVKRRVLFIRAGVIITYELFRLHQILNILSYRCR